MTIKVTFSSIEVTISIVYLSSVTLLEPFARAQVQDRGCEKRKRCDSENGVVHERKNRLRVLRKCSEGDKEVVSGTKREVKKQRRNDKTWVRGMVRDRPSPRGFSRKSMNLKVLQVQTRKSVILKE